MSASFWCYTQLKHPILMSSIAPLRGKLGQYSGQARKNRKIKVKKSLYFWLLFQAFVRPSCFLLDIYHPRSKSEVKRGLVGQTHCFPFPCREWSRHIVYKGGMLRIRKLHLSVRDEWYNSNQTIHHGLIICFLTLSLRITCTSVEYK